MAWTGANKPFTEAYEVRWDIVEYTRGRTLDIGSGPHKLFPHFTNVDQCNGFQMSDGSISRPDIVAPADALPFSDCSQDSVFSSHCLEDLEDTAAALREWWRVLKVGGYLCLYLPHRDLYPNVGEPGANQAHKHDFVPDDIVGFMREVGDWDLAVNETRDGDNVYSFFQVYRKRDDGEQTFSCDWPKPSKTACVVRYGGFGDMIQASSVLPALKKQGYHVTVMTTPKGMDVLRHDPHVDRFMLQDTDQVPNNELRAFWEHHKNKFTRFINLSESVEGTVLPIPDRSHYHWPKDIRHTFCNHNYLEVTHGIADVPLPPQQRFYPSQYETAWARSMKKGKPCILMTLAGSSVHKMWPHMDTWIARVLTSFPKAHIWLVGDALCEVLETGWEKEKRVHRRSGKWSIRETLAFAKECDLVIGPETGVLNAVGLEDMPKICMLSHSTVENLTKHWKNTYSIEPEGCACYPCHRLHYGFDYCKKSDNYAENGSSDCMAKTSIDTVWAATLKALGVNNGD